MSESGGRRRGARRGKGEASSTREPANTAGAGPTPGGDAGPRDANARAADAPPSAGDAAQAGPGAGSAGPPHIDRSVCLCAGLGPMLTQALRTLSVPDEVKQSLHDTEREALRLLRTLIEMRLSSLRSDDGPAREPARGVKLDVS